jgi:hypothetical protein
MASLIDLEFNRDDLVEQVMAFIEEEEVEGKTDTIALINSFDELETQIATKRMFGNTESIKNQASLRSISRIMAM